MTSLLRRLLALENPDGAILLPDPGRDADRDQILAEARRKHPGKPVGFALPKSPDANDFI